RPPAYYTPDWVSAYESLRRLLELRPAVAITGHRLPMRGAELEDGLRRLVENFRREMPRRGRYVFESATFDQHGVVSVPPPVPDVFPKLVIGAAVAATVAAPVPESRRDD